MYDDFYNNESSEWDMFIDEVKQHLMNSVKKEYIEKMEKLEKENKELQYVKKNWESIKQDYENKKQEFNFNKNELMRELSRKRLRDLIDSAEIHETVYYIDIVYVYPDLCGKCDDRKIHFKSPSGKDMTEPCPVCGTKYKKYIVKDMDVIDIWFGTSKKAYYDEHQKVETRYKEKDEWGEFTTFTKRDVFNGDVKDFNYEYYWSFIFTSKELAEKICDKLNKEHK